MTQRFACLSLLFACALARAGDVKVTLDSFDGASAFLVLDSQSNQLARVESGGAVIGGGKGNLAGAAFASVGGGVKSGSWMGSRWLLKSSASARLRALASRRRIGSKPQRHSIIRRMEQCS